MSEETTIPDREYVEQFQESTGPEKKRAFSALYERHEQELRWYILRLTQNKKLSNDLVQETFKKALEGLENFEGRSSFKTWLYRIATNTWKNYLKKNRPVSGGVEEKDRVDMQTPDEIVDVNERVDQVCDAVQELPEKLRAALVLVRFEDMKYKEAASALDISLSALKLRVYRASKKLKEMTDYEDDDVT